MAFYMRVLYEASPQVEILDEPSPHVEMYSSLCFALPTFRIAFSVGSFIRRRSSQFTPSKCLGVHS